MLLFSVGGSASKGFRFFILYKRKKIMINYEMLQILPYFRNQTTKKEQCFLTKVIFICYLQAAANNNLGMLILCKMVAKAADFSFLCTFHTKVTSFCVKSTYHHNYQKLKKMNTTLDNNFAHRIVQSPANVVFSLPSWNKRFTEKRQH